MTWETYFESGLTDLHTPNHWVSLGKNGQYGSWWDNLRLLSGTAFFCFQFCIVSPEIAGRDLALCRTQLSAFYHLINAITHNVGGLPQLIIETKGKFQAKPVLGTIKSFLRSNIHLKIKRVPQKMTFCASFIRIYKLTLPIGTVNLFLGKELYEMNIL